MTQLSVIVPTFREAENLTVLIPRLQQVFTDASVDGEIIVVDDNSPDETVNVVERLSQAHPVRLMIRRNERGLSSAVIAGMRAAHGDVLLCMDADLSHPPEDVPRLFRQVAATSNGRSSDFVIGSRYVPGGSTEMGWGLGRWLNSKVATWLAWPLASVRDPMAGFFALPREAFLRAAEHLDPIGYKIGLELLVKTGARTVTEVPIEFKNRLHGESKLSLREQFNYLRHLARLYRFRFPRLTRFLSFGLVGSSGAVVDLLAFVLLLNSGLSPLSAAVLAIWAAMTSNFELNRRLTFAEGDRSWGQAYLSFCLSCLFGAGVNTGVRVGLMSSVTWFSGHAWGAAVLGILSGLAFNFSLCERFVFRKSRGARFQRPSLQEISCFAKDGHIENDPYEGGILAQSEGTRGQGVRTVKPRASWLFRLLPLIVVVLSVLWAKSLSSQSRKPTLERSEKQTNRQTADFAEPTPSKADHREIPKSASGSSSQPLSKYREFGFSDIDIEQRLKASVRYLASDELEGRGLDTAGLDKAAEFIAQEYEQAGLNSNPAGHGVFFEFPLLARELQPVVSQVTLLQGSNKVLHPLTRKQDYSSVIVPKPKHLSGELVFAGFGISAPEHGYDDFEGLDVSGCVVIVLRHEPAHETWRKLATEQDYTSHALLRTKIQKAMSRGAEALVLCNANASSPRDSDNHSDELLSVDLTAEFPNVTMPVIHVRRAALATLLAKTAQFDLDAAEVEIHRTLKPQSQRLKNLAMAIRVERPRASRTLKNVIATLSTGQPSRDETIVVGAHYDHLGRGGWGSLELTNRREIHNGADDNASGTAVLLEVARQLAAREALNPDKPLPRRVCFIAFSAEELGLIGSNKYAQTPWFPMERTVAMLNLDMVGRLRNDQLTVYGTGTSSIWPPLLRRLADNYGLNVQSREGGYGPSDHASFHERGVPVLHFFTGFHSNYHRPSDDPDTLNYVGLRKLSRAVAEMVVSLAEMPERPHRSTPQRDLAEFDLSTIALPDVVGTSRPPMRFQLGVQLAPSKSGGALVERTIPQSLAERHGLRSGDVIQTINGEPIDSPAAAITQIQSHHLHAPLIISLIRNGLRMKINVSMLD